MDKNQSFVCKYEKTILLNFIHFSFIFRSCAEKQYSSGKISHLSLIHSNIKYNKVLALLNRTFCTLYELSIHFKVRLSLSTSHYLR
jgi:hypothetical protein